MRLVVVTEDGSVCRAKMAHLVKLADLSPAELENHDQDLLPAVFVCGDDDEAKTIVQSLVADIGAHRVDARPLTAARLTSRP